MAMTALCSSTIVMTNYDADASVSIYVYIEDGKRVFISGQKLGGVLERMLANQDFLAVLENIT